MRPSKIHPGVHLRELLKEHGISQSHLARHLKTKIGAINEVCNGKRGISVQLAQRLALAFGSSVEFWLNLQMAYDLGRAAKPLKISRIVGSRAA